jgi:flavin-dependent dehydrogenase
MSGGCSAIGGTIPATLSPQQAACIRWQVIVVGGGPAGAAAAQRLAGRGVRVLLIDRAAMPRWKICGCCLSVSAIDELRALERLDVASAAAPIEAAPLDDVRLAAGGRSVLLPMPGGRVVSRETLDATIVRRAIALGCHWLPNASVAAVGEPSSGGPAPLVVELTEPGAVGRSTVRLETEACVLATGLTEAVRLPAAGQDPAELRPRDLALAGPPAANRIGVGGALDPQAAGPEYGRLVMAVAAGGYCGLVRLPDGRIDVAAALDRRLVREQGSPAAAVAAVLEHALGVDAAGLVDVAALSAAEFRATPPLTRSLPLVVGAEGRILRIGDAAGYVEPFTGEGIGWSLASARLLVASLLDAAGGLRAPRDAAARYVTAHRGHFGPLHRRCRRTALALRRPLLVMAAVHAAQCAPWAARRLVPMVIGAGRRGGDASWG